MMKALKTLNDWVGKVEAIFLVVLLTSMILLAFLQVVMRNVFNAGIPWADTVVRTLVLWVGLIGAALATKQNQNLTIEVLTKYMPERMRHISSAAVKAFAVVVCWFLFQATRKFLTNESSTGEQFLHLFPSWYALIIIEIGFVLIPFHLLISILQDIEYFRKGTP